MKYWEIIADRLHAEGWSYGIAEHLTKHGVLFCVDAEWKLLRCSFEYCLPNLTPPWANRNLGANRSDVVSGADVDLTHQVEARMPSEEKWYALTWPRR